MYHYTIAFTFLTHLFWLRNLYHTWLIFNVLFCVHFANLSRTHTFAYLQPLSPQLLLKSYFETIDSTKCFKVLNYSTLAGTSLALSLFWAHSFFSRRYRCHLYHRFRPFHSHSPHILVVALHHIIAAFPVSHPFFYLSVFIPHCNSLRRFGDTRQEKKKGNQYAHRLSSHPTTSVNVFVHSPTLHFSTTPPPTTTRRVYAVSTSQAAVHPVCLSSFIHCQPFELSIVPVSATGNTTVCITWLHSHFFALFSVIAVTSVLSLRGQARQVESCRSKPSRQWKGRSRLHQSHRCRTSVGKSSSVFSSSQSTETGASKSLPSDPSKSSTSSALLPSHMSRRHLLERVVWPRRGLWPFRTGGVKLRHV